MQTHHKRNYASFTKHQKFDSDYVLRVAHARVKILVQKQVVKQQVDRAGSLELWNSKERNILTSRSNPCMACPSGPYLYSPSYLSAGCAKLGKCLYKWPLQRGRQEEKKEHNSMIDSGKRQELMDRANPSAAALASLFEEASLHTRAF